MELELKGHNWPEDSLQLFFTSLETTGKALWTHTLSYSVGTQLGDEKKVLWF